MEYRLPSQLTVGIETDLIGLGPYPCQMDEMFDVLVSEYEEREAAVFAQISWRTLIEMEPWERAATIAHYHLHMRVEAHIQDAAKSQAGSGAA